jgi:hypothetical protein
MYERGKKQNGIHNTKRNTYPELLRGGRQVVFVLFFRDAARARIEVGRARLVAASNRIESNRKG